MSEHSASWPPSAAHGARSPAATRMPRVGPRLTSLHPRLWRPFCAAQHLQESLCPTLERRLSGQQLRWKQVFLASAFLQRAWCKGPLPPRVNLRAQEGHVITCLLMIGCGRLVSASDDHTLRVWDLHSQQCLHILVGHSGGVWCCAASGNVLVSGSTDHTLRVWDLTTGRCVHTLYGHNSTVRCVRAVGNIAVSGSRDTTLRLWDLTSGECLGVLARHIEPVRCLEFDGETIVSGSYDFTCRAGSPPLTLQVRVWRASNNELVHTLAGHTNRVYSLQFEGTIACSGSLDMTIRVWDVVQGALLHILHGHQSLTGLMHMANGILVSGNSDATLRVWRVASGECIHTLAGHTSAVTCLSVNGNFITSCSDDGSVKLWDLRDGRFIRTIADFNRGNLVVWRIQCSADILVCAVGRQHDNHSSVLAMLDFFNAAALDPSLP